MDLEKEILMEEGMDLRFFVLRLWKKIWIVFVAALAGAAICAGGYKLYQQINPAAKEYRAETKYYIDFAEDSTGIGYGYYNDYTWNDWMKSDDILQYTMGLLPEDISKEEVEAAVVADIISDVRLLTITVTDSDREHADKIAQATAGSLQHFPEEIKEIDGIRVIREDAAKEVVVGETTKNRAVSGCCMGALAALFVLCLAVCMDTAVYLPADIEKRYSLTVLGVLYAKETAKKMPGDKEVKEDKEAKEDKKELLANAEYLLKDKQRIALVGLDEKVGKYKITDVLKTALQAEFSEDDFSDGRLPDYEKLRSADAVVVCFSYGKTNGKRAERLLADLRMQDCKITHAIICGADPKMYRRYFWRKK